VPWNGRAIVGTEYGAHLAGDAQAGVAAFLERARRAFPWAGLRDDDVVLVHRGRVPGRDERALVTRHRLIDHERAHGLPGLVTIVSAKFTTARAAAEEAVNVAVRRLQRPPVRCRTAETPLDAARPLAGDLATRARTALRDEMALHLDDAVRRRLDLGTAGPPASADVEEVGAVMAAELGWTAERLQAEMLLLWRSLAPPATAA